MPKTVPPTNADELAARLKLSSDKLAESMQGGASEQVMAGFAEAYRAWLEAISAKPETMMDLQGRYMQEQMRLWMGAMQATGTGGGNGSNGEGAAPDKRFA